MMQDEGTTVEGTDIHIKTSSEATAREIAGALEGERVRREGTAREKIGARIDVIDDITDELGRSGMVVVSWGFAFVAMVIAYFSWSRILPLKDETLLGLIGLDVLFGILGVFVVLLVKVTAGRWAKASATSDETADFWKWICLTAAFAELVVALFWSFAAQDDVVINQGTHTVEVVAMKGEARRMRSTADALPRPPDTSEVIEQQLNDQLDAIARNLQGQPTRMTVREIIGFGEDDFCMPEGQYLSIRDKYCPDVADLIRAQSQREIYEDAIAAANAREAEALALELNPPKAASGMAVGEKIDDGTFVGAVLKSAPTALVMLFVLVLMIIATYAASRHPIVQRHKEA